MYRYLAHPTNPTLAAEALLLRDQEEDDEDQENDEQDEEEESEEDEREGYSE